MISLDDSLKIAKGLIRQKDFIEAEAILLESLKTTQSNLLLFGHLVDLYIKMARFDEAEKYIELILSKEPENFYALQKKGDILVKRGVLNDAMEIYLENYNKNCNDYYLIKRITRLYIIMNNLKKALEYAMIGRDKFPEIADSHFQLYQVYDKLEDFKSAGESINRALKIEPDNKYFYSQKISLRLKEKNLNSSNIEEIIDLSNEENPFLLKLLADRLKKDGKFDNALKVFKKLISIDDSEFNRKGLAYLYYKMKDYKNAFKIFIALSDSNFTDNIFLSTIIASAKDIDDKNQLAERMTQLAEGSGQYRKLWGKIKKLGKEIIDEENK